MNTLLLLGPSRKHDPDTSACQRDELWLSRGLGSLFLFQTCVATRAELCLKLFYSSSSVNKFQFACKKRMANIANINLYLRYRTSCRKGISTTTLHDRFRVLWVNAFFHRIHLSIYGACRNSDTLCSKHALSQAEWYRRTQHWAIGLPLLGFKTPVTR